MQKGKKAAWKKKGEEGNRPSDEYQALQNLHYDVASILHFKHIKFRFGKIPVESYSKLQEYLMDDICSIFDECGRDENYIWGVYFVPAAEEEKVDAVYASLHFERTFIDDDYEGTVEEAYDKLTARKERA